MTPAEFRRQIFDALDTGQMSDPPQAWLALMALPLETRHMLSHVLEGFVACDPISWEDNR